jgi:hypothetical protein
MNDVVFIIHRFFDDGFLERANNHFECVRPIIGRFCQGKVPDRRAVKTAVDQHDPQKNGAQTQNQTQ